MSGARRKKGEGGERSGPRDSRGEPRSDPRGGDSRGPSRGAKPATPSAPDARQEAANMADRVHAITASLTGKHVNVQKVDGTWYEGIFHACNTSPDGKFSIVLKMAYKENDRKGFVKPAEVMVFQPHEFCQMVAKEVELLRDIQSGDDGHRAPGKFATDTEISGDTLDHTRELVPWMADGDCGDMGLELGSSRGGKPGSWDQFQTNKARFGVQSSYSEELYTTRLDKSAPDYKAKAAIAEKLANEIEARNREQARAGPYNRHLIEESGGDDCGDANDDEEELYSAVVRAPAASTSTDKKTDQSKQPDQGRPAATAAGLGGGGLLATPGSTEERPASGTGERVLSALEQSLKKLNPKAPEFKPGGAAAPEPMGGVEAGGPSFGEQGMRMGGDMGFMGGGGAGFYPNQMRPGMPGQGMGPGPHMFGPGGPGQMNRGFHGGFGMGGGGQFVSPMSPPQGMMGGPGGQGGQGGQGQGMYMSPPPGFGPGSPPPGGVGGPTNAFFGGGNMRPGMGQMGPRGPLSPQGQFGVYGAPGGPGMPSGQFMQGQGGMPGMHGGMGGGNMQGMSGMGGGAGGGRGFGGGGEGGAGRGFAGPGMGMPQGQPHGQGQAMQGGRQPGMEDQ